MLYSSTGGGIYVKTDSTNTAMSFASCVLYGNSADNGKCAICICSVACTCQCSFADGGGVYAEADDDNASFSFVGFSAVNNSAGSGEKCFPASLLAVVSCVSLYTARRGRLVRSAG